MSVSRIRWKDLSDSEAADRIQREGLTSEQVQHEMEQEEALQKEMSERSNAQYGIGTKRQRGVI